MESLQGVQMLSDVFLGRGAKKAFSVCLCDVVHESLG